jgi:2-oxoisovalerate dehydrogenase E1 component
MFGDFTTLIVDQLLQHASKFHKMYGRDVSVPMCVRTPMGGRRGYGPTHSQSIERLFIGVPDLQVFSPNHRVDVAKLYNSIFSLSVPTFVAEHKLGYNLDAKQPVPDQYEILSTKEQFPTLLIRPVGYEPSATVMTYGYGLALTENALKTLAKRGVWVEVICPTRLSPLNADLILKSLIRTERFVGFEEGSATHGVAAACLAFLVTRGVSPRASMLIGNDSIIPAGEAELSTLPGEQELVASILRMLERSS